MTIPSLAHCASPTGNETPLQGWHRTKTIISRPAHRRQFSRPWRGTGRTWSAWSTLAAALVRGIRWACAGPGMALCADRPKSGEWH